MSDINSKPAKTVDPACADGSRVREAMERKIRVDREDKERRKELDPTRYGDWEKNGRCIDF